MDCTRHQLLAGARLSQNNYISLGRCDSSNLGQDLLQRRTVPNDVPETGPKFVLEEFIFKLEVLLLGDAAQRHHPANHFAGVIAVRSRFYMNPVPSSVLALHFELEAFGLVSGSLVSRAVVPFPISAQQVRS